MDFPSGSVAQLLVSRASHWRPTPQSDPSRGASISLGYTQKFCPLGSAGGSMYNMCTSQRGQPELASWGVGGLPPACTPCPLYHWRSSPRRPDCKHPEGSGLFLS